MWTKRNTLLRPLKNVASGTFWIDQSITYLSTLPHVEEKRGLLQKALDLGKVLVWLCLCVWVWKCDCMCGCAVFTQHLLVLVLVCISVVIVWIPCCRCYLSKSETWMLLAKSLKLPVSLWKKRRKNEVGFSQMTKPAVWHLDPEMQFLFHLSAEPTNQSWTKIDQMFYSFSSVHFGWGRIANMVCSSERSLA